VGFERRLSSNLERGTEGASKTIAFHSLELKITLVPDEGIDRDCKLREIVDIFPGKVI